MSDAYRDDLEAARARVSDLEREAERLRKRNAELTALDRERVAASEKRAPIAAPTPEPSAITKTMVVLAQMCVGMALAALGVRRFHTGPEPTPHPGWATIFLGLAFVFWWFSGFQPLWKRR